MSIICLGFLASAQSRVGGLEPEPEILPPGVSAAAEATPRHRLAQSRGISASQGPGTVDEGVAGATVKRAGGFVTREVLVADAANLPPIAPTAAVQEGDGCRFTSAERRSGYREDARSRVDGVSGPPRRLQIAESRRSDEPS
jgi:hypothetical protein